jgi:hypothetical protein
MAGCSTFAVHAAKIAHNVGDLMSLRDEPGNGFWERLQAGEHRGADAGKAIAGQCALGSCSVFACRRRVPVFDLLLPRFIP